MSVRYLIAVSMLVLSVSAKPTERPAQSKDKVDCSQAANSLSSRLVTLSGSTQVNFTFHEASAKRMKKPNTPVRNVCVFGPPRSGKGTLMNFLAGVPGVFEVGAKGICTKGVWASNNVYKLQNTTTVRYIDTEGLGNEEANYDYGLAVSILPACDLVLFNIRHFEGQRELLHKLNYLLIAYEKVIENVQNRVTLRRNEAFLYPPLILVMRDWHLKITEEQYVADMLNVNDPTAKQVALVRAGFQSVHAAFLPTPANPEKLSNLKWEHTTRQFRNSFDAFKSKMQNLLHKPVKTLLSNPDGRTEDFLKYARLLSEGLNSQELNLPDILDTIEKEFIRDIEIHVINTTNAKTQGIQLPLHAPQLQQAFDQIRQEALHVFYNRTSRYNGSAVQLSGEQTVRNALLQQESLLQSRNQHEISEQSLRIQKLKTEFKTRIGGCTNQSLPMNRTELQSVLHQCSQDILSSFDQDALRISNFSDVNDARRALESDIKAETQQVTLLNEERLRIAKFNETLVAMANETETMRLEREEEGKIRQVGLHVYDLSAAKANQLPLPIDSSLLHTQLAAVMREGLEEFDNETSQYSNSRVLSDERQSLKRFLHQLESTLKTRNHNAILDRRQEISQVKERLKSNHTKCVEILPLPMNETEQSIALDHCTKDVLHLFDHRTAQHGNSSEVHATRTTFKTELLNELAKRKQINKDLLESTERHKVLVAIIENEKLARNEENEARNVVDDAQAQALDSFQKRTRSLDAHLPMDETDLLLELNAFEQASLREYNATCNGNKTKNHTRLVDNARRQLADSVNLKRLNVLGDNTKRNFARIQKVQDDRKRIVDTFRSCIGVALPISETVLAQTLARCAEGGSHSFKQAIQTYANTIDIPDQMARLLSEFEVFAKFASDSNIQLLESKESAQNASKIHEERQKNLTEGFNKFRADQTAMLEDQKKLMSEQIERQKELQKQLSEKEKQWQEEQEKFKRDMAHSNEQNQQLLKQQADMFEKQIQLQRESSQQQISAMQQLIASIPRQKKTEWWEKALEVAVPVAVGTLG